MSVEKILELNNEFQQEVLSEMNENYTLIDEFSKRHTDEVRKLPYRFNVLSLLRTNENAHSVFLQQLFLYKKNKCFEALESFLNSLMSEKFHFEFKIDNPEITAERHRIDVLIMEKGKYAIIIENKIHYAVEQENQVDRYIEKCKSLGFSENQIYVLYLTRLGGEPTDYSLNNENKKKLLNGKRYLPISFDIHIYNWLKEYQQKIENEDILKSAIVQYLDYLEELLQKNNIYIEMNRQLNKFLNDKLNLNQNFSLEKIDIIDEKINEISNLQLQLKNLKEEKIKGFFKEIEEKLRKDFKEIEENKSVSLRFVNNIETEKNYPNVAVVFEYEGKLFSVLMEREVDRNRIYYGIGRHYASDTLQEDVETFFSPLIEMGFQKSAWWYGYKYSEFQTIYEELKILIEYVIKKLEK